LVVNIVASRRIEALQWMRDRLVSTNIKHSVGVAESACLGSTDVRKGKATRGNHSRGADPEPERLRGRCLSDFMRATRLEKGGVYRHLGGAQVPAGEAIAEEGQRLGEVRSDGCRYLEEYLDTDICATGFGVRAGRP
jgi:hypothetical protein